MSGLQKAKLSEITSTPQGTTIGNPIEVQFNPASLKLSLSNTVEGGASRTQSVRQFVGKSSTDLSFDLVFDSADEITEGGPVSVRERTAAIERFVVPKTENGQKLTPPKVRFEWGGLVIDGVIESLNIDFELFAPDGVPLRAKIGISIKEQDAKYMFMDNARGGDSRAGGSNALNAPRASGAGSQALQTKPVADAQPGQPGTSGGGNANRSAAAVAGESLAEFAARQGLDPNAWRALASQVENPLSLPAGLELNFDPALNTGGLGTTTNPETVAPPTVDEALGLAPSVASTLSGATALTAAGGPTAAVVAAAATKAEEAAALERRAFQAPTASNSAAVAAAPQSVLPAGKPAELRTPPADPAAGAALALTPVEPDRTPLRECAEPIVFCVTPAQPPTPRVAPYVDPRTLTYGLGVPLRTRVRGAVDDRASHTAGGAVLRYRNRPTEAVVPRDPTIAPWVQLPVVDPARVIADQKSKARPSNHCGCAPTSKSKGGKCRCTSGK